MTPTKIISLSDPHCGSVVGLCPPRIELEDGSERTHGNNLFQAMLWQWWLEGREWIDSRLKGDPFILLLNGDLIEGIHHGGKETVSREWDMHMEIALDCLGDLCDAAHAVLITKGTECHTQNIENALAQSLGAEGGKAKDQWLFEINGVLNEAQHHCGTTKRVWLESGEAARVMMNHIANCALAGHRTPRVFWRAHRHVSGHYQTRNRHALIGGGWQFLTRYGHKVVGDSIPMPSIWYGDYSEPEHLVFLEKIFTPPQEKATTF